MCVDYFLDRCQVYTVKFPLFSYWPIKIIPQKKKLKHKNSFRSFSSISFIQEVLKHFQVSLTVFYFVIFHTLYLQPVVFFSLLKHIKQWRHKQPLRVRLLPLQFLLKTQLFGAQVLLFICLILSLYCKFSTKLFISLLYYLPYLFHFAQHLLWMALTYVLLFQIIYKERSTKLGLTQFSTTEFQICHETEHDF